MGRRHTPSDGNRRLRQLSPHCDGCRRKRRGHLGSSTTTVVPMQSFTYSVQAARFSALNNAWSPALQVSECQFRKGCRRSGRRQRQCRRTLVRGQRWLCLACTRCTLRRGEQCLGRGTTDPDRSGSGGLREGGHGCDWQSRGGVDRRPAQRYPRLHDGARNAAASDQWSAPQLLATASGLTARAPVGVRRRWKPVLCFGSTVTARTSSVSMRQGRPRRRALGTCRPRSRVSSSGAVPRTPI